MAPGIQGGFAIYGHAGSGPADYHSLMPFPRPAAFPGRFARLAPSVLAAAISMASGADMQPRSYSYLLSHADLVAVGTVDGVSTGFLSENRKAVIDVNGIIKGKVFTKKIEVAWSDKEFEETAYKDGAKVVVFADMAKDTTYTQVSPGISCWPVEKVNFKGKPVRAVEYAFPMDLMTEVPNASLKETTEEVEKSMNFQMAKRKTWILTDQLLPPVKPVVLPKPPKAKPVAKSASRMPAKPTKRKAAKGKGVKSMF
ncbi:MAG: hypothetical protein JWP91_1978 [Fibrobacteres bacterium]|nr:hypothetical protein [Fibrobacterota bacterium]